MLVYFLYLKVKPRDGYSTSAPSMGGGGIGSVTPLKLKSGGQCPSNPDAMVLKINKYIE